MRPILMPDRAKARRALCAPGPGVLVLLPPVARSLMCTAEMPSSYKVSIVIAADASISAVGAASDPSAKGIPCI